MSAATNVAPPPSRYDGHARTRQPAAAEQAAPVRVLPRAQARKRAQPAPHLSVRGALVFVCVMALMLFIVYAYTQMAEMGSVSQNLTKDISRLQQEGSTLLRQKSDMIDLQEVERIAVEELGMVKPNRSQIIYINLSGQDHAVVFGPGAVPDVTDSEDP